MILFILILFLSVAFSTHSRMTRSTRSSSIFAELDDLLGTVQTSGVVELPFSLAHLANCISCESITGGKVRHIIRNKGGFYVVTGARYQHGTANFYLQPCIPIAARKAGGLKPRSYRNKTDLIDRAYRANKTRGNRLRSEFYAGMQFTYQGKVWMFLNGKLEARPQTIPTIVHEQLALF